MARFANWVESRLRDPRVRIGFEVERFILETKEELLRALRNANLTQREIAERLGVKEATVSRALSRTHNLTLKTLCSLALSAGFRPRIRLEQLSMDEVPWKRKRFDAPTRSFSATFGSLGSQVRSYVRDHTDASDRKPEDALAA